MWTFLEDKKRKTITNIAILFGGIAFFQLLSNFSLVLIFFQSLFNIFSPFIIGMIIAFILNVPMNFFEERLFYKRKISRKIKRALSIALTIAVILLIFFVVMFLVVPEIINSFSILKENLPDFISSTGEFLRGIGIGTDEIEQYININYDAIISNIASFTKNGVGIFINSAFGAVSSIVGTIINSVIGGIFAIYILSQKEKLSSQIKKILYILLNETKVLRIIDVSRKSSEVFSNFLMGQCVEALILGSMFFIAMSIFRMPYALLISVLIAVTALIPIFGAFIGCIVGAFLILMLNPMQAIWFIVLFLVLQQIEGNLIYPHVVGNSVGLPSMWVLVAVTLGASLMGIVGMILFIPVFAVIYSLFKEFVNDKYNNKISRAAANDNK